MTPPPRTTSASVNTNSGKISLFLNKQHTSSGWKTPGFPLSLPMPEVGQEGTPCWTDACGSPGPPPAAGSPMGGVAARPSRRGRPGAAARGQARRPRVEAGGRRHPASSGGAGARQPGGRRRLRATARPLTPARWQRGPRAPAHLSPGRLGGTRPATPPDGLGAGALAATAGRGRQHGGVSGGGFGSTTTAAAAIARAVASSARRSPLPGRAALGGARSSRPAAGRRLRWKALG